VTTVPRPAFLSREQQSDLNALRFRWDRAYRIACDGRLWSAECLASGDVMRADSAPLLKSQIIGHYAGQGAGRIR
jgi:hypothetical protein